MTVRESLEGLLSRTKDPAKRAKLEAELELPPFPTSLKYLWDWYFRIRRRKGGGLGTVPVEWPDIGTFSSLNRISLAPWEITALETIDDIFLSEASKPGSAQ